MTQGAFLLFRSGALLGGYSLYKYVLEFSSRCYQTKIHQHSPATVHYCLLSICFQTHIQEILATLNDTNQIHKASCDVTSNAATTAADVTLDIDDDVSTSERKMLDKTITNDNIQV